MPALTGARGLLDWRDVGRRTTSASTLGAAVSMHTKPRPERQPRRKTGTLSRERILEGAKTLIARDGLRALSMPALAREVGSGVTSLYWYFTDKSELIDTLTEEVLTAIHQRLPQIAAGPWEDALVVHFNELRRALIEDATYRELVAYDLMSIARRPPLPQQAARVKAGFALLERKGLTRQQCVAVMSALSNYTRGFVVLEVPRLSSPTHA